MYEGIIKLKLKSISSPWVIELIGQPLKYILKIKFLYIYFSTKMNF